jgi:hypothetical protein
MALRAAVRHAEGNSAVGAPRVGFIDRRIEGHDMLD